MYGHGAFTFMAMKPAGKAIIVLAIVGALGAGIWKSGMLDKVPTAAPVTVIAVEPAMAPSTPPTPAPAVQPTPVQEAPKAKDALDALIHEQKK